MNEDVESNGTGGPTVEPVLCAYCGMPMSRVDRRARPDDPPRLDSYFYCDFDAYACGAS